MDRAIARVLIPADDREYDDISLTLAECSGWAAAAAAASPSPTTSTTRGSAKKQTQAHKHSALVMITGAYRNAPQIIISLRVAHISHIIARTHMSLRQETCCNSSLGNMIIACRRSLADSVRQESCDIRHSGNDTHTQTCTKKQSGVTHSCCFACRRSSSRLSICHVIQL